MYFLYAWLLAPGLFLLLGAVLIIVWSKSKIQLNNCFFLLALVVYAFSIGLVSDILIAPLEKAYLFPMQSDLRDAQVIVVLSGGSYVVEHGKTREAQLSGVSANRLQMGVRLYRTLRIPIILTGDLGVSVNTLSKIFNIRKEDIMIEGKSCNTLENAKFTKQLCTKLGFSKIILVTSASHLPRSVLLFEREGMSVIPCPADYRTDYVRSMDLRSLIPSYHSLSNSALALKEYLGILAIKTGIQ